MKLYVSQHNTIQLQHDQITVKAETSLNICVNLEVTRNATEKYLMQRDAIIMQLVLALFYNA